MVFLTGDTHSDFLRFATKRFPEQKRMTRDDVVVILGDFGGIWAQKETTNEKHALDWLNDKPFTTCFVDGNHENFDRLLSEEFPLVEFHGGMARRVREHVFYLPRGRVFEFDGKRFFTMGGASSHDIRDGILDPDQYADQDAFNAEYRRRWLCGEQFRVNHFSWWKQEIPSVEEMDSAREALREVDYTVDYVLAHCLPQSVAAALGFSDPDPLTLFFDSLLDEGLTFSHWHCGHYHTTTDMFLQYHVHYEDIERII